MNAHSGMAEATYHWEAKFSKQKGYVGMNGRLSEQKNLTSHMKCRQKGVNGKW